MAQKDILVVLDGTPAAAARVNLVTALARRFDGHLTGLFTVSTPIIPPYAAAHNPPDAFKAQHNGVIDAAQLVRSEFDAARAAAGVNGEWRQAERPVSEVAVLHARYADLGQWRGRATPTRVGTLGTASAMPEQLALEAGLPVLVVRYAGRFDTVGKRVQVAWNAGREAARAIGDTMPLIEGRSTS